mmetsp:Transcript_102407/g.298611  ORF Transcript_102407/g.298611 Transcript_102407/m.298611 type:complete len:369 (-) Transcript_102407:234-1340(-)
MAATRDEDLAVACEQMEDPLCKVSDAGEGADLLSRWTRRRRLLAAGASAALLLGVGFLLCASPGGAGRGLEVQDYNQSVVLQQRGSTMDYVRSNKQFWKREWDRSYATTYGWGAGQAVRSFSVGSNRVRVYRDAGRECTVVFSATNTLGGDCSQGEGPPTNVPGCQLRGVYSCFARVTFAILQDPRWSGIADYLTSRQCSGGVNTAGWSLGAVKATIFATCANHARGGGNSGVVTVNGIRIRLPRVKNIFTFGAARVSDREQPTNGQRNSGAFGGLRFWSERPVNGGIEIDECVNVPTPGPSPSHPKMQAMRLRLVTGVTNPATSARLYGAGSNQAQGTLNYRTSGRCVSNIHSQYGTYVQGIVSARP